MHTPRDIALDSYHFIDIDLIDFSPFLLWILCIIALCILLISMIASTRNYLEFSESLEIAWDDLFGNLNRGTASIAFN